MPVKQNREYRAVKLPFSLPENAEKRFDTEFEVQGYATTFNVPYEIYEFDGVKYFEIIERSALDGADMSDVIMQYDHSGKVLARQSNSTLIIEPDNHGLKVYADLSKSTSSKELYGEIKSGLINKMSWAFRVIEDSYDKETHTRTIKKIRKVYDVSAVSIPANDDTDIAARSYFDGVIEMEKQELLERKRRIQKLKLLTEV